MIYRSRAPLRVSFAGGGTDVSPYPETRGGAVLSATVGMYAYATLRPRGDGLVRVNSLDYDLGLEFPCDRVPPADGRLDLIKGTLRAGGGLGPGLDLIVHSDATPGSGLGSSSALVVAILGALAAWRGEAWRHEDPTELGALAETAYRIERVDLGIPGGRQDQYAAAFGGFNFIEFLPGRTVVHPLRPRAATLRELQYNLLLWFTGRTRPDANIVRAQVSSYQAGEAAVVAALDELKRLALEMKDALLRGELVRFAGLLGRGWAAKKKLAGRISDEGLDLMYGRAVAAGALGGKLLGAGGGGYLLLYCPGETRTAVARALGELGGQPVPLRFEPCGLETWELRAGGAVGP